MTRKHVHFFHFWLFNICELPQFKIKKSILVKSDALKLQSTFIMKVWKKHVLESLPKVKDISGKHYKQDFWLLIHKTNSSKVMKKNDVLCKTFLKKAFLKNAKCKNKIMAINKCIHKVQVYLQEHLGFCVLILNIFFIPELLFNKWIYDLDAKMIQISGAKIKFYK